MKLEELQKKLLPSCREPAPSVLLSQGDIDTLCYWAKLSIELKGDMLEIGAFQGGSTICALESSEGKKNMQSVDINNNKTFLPNIKNNGFKDNHSFYHMDCLRFFRTQHYLNTTYSYIFIDHDHSYENTKLCLENLWPRLNKGGAILVHDYEHPNYPEATEYLNENWKQGYSPPNCGIYVIQK
jgi:predicted O-methyltransferase YrrM